MKILLYGFKSRYSWKKNISEEILKRVKKKENLVKVVFPTRFSKKQFVDTIKKHDPDIILGLGQSYGSGKIRIERRAVNRKKVNRKATPVVINENLDGSVNLNVKIKPDKDSRISYAAGQYVCNFSMFIIANYLKDARFAFFHVPRKYEIRKATQYISNKISDLQKEMASVIAQKSLKKYL